MNEFVFKEPHFELHFLKPQTSLNSQTTSAARHQPSMPSDFKWGLVELRMTHAPFLYDHVSTKSRFIALNSQRSDISGFWPAFALLAIVFLYGYVLVAFQFLH